MEMNNLPRQDLLFLCRKNGIPAKTNIEMAKDLKHLKVIKGMDEFVSSPRGVAYRFSYKVLLLGEPGVGKTTFLERFLLARQRKVRVTSITNIYPVEFITNRGKITFDCWDSDRYMHFGQCAIIMFSILSKHSCKKVSYWCRQISEACGDIPIVVCCNKMDSDHGLFRPTDCHRFINQRRNQPTVLWRGGRAGPEYDFKLVKISSLANQNLEDVFNFLAAKLTYQRNLWIDPASYQLAEAEAERFQD